MARSSFINNILQKKTITELLTSRGIVPAREHGDKKQYHCPIHKGDNDPSFVVYTGGEYENYYCFGCHSGGTIINLLSELDDMSTKKAVGQLADGLDFGGPKERERIIIENLRNYKVKSHYRELEEIALEIYVRCYRHFEYVEFDEEEVDFFHKVYEQVDRVTRGRDIETLKKIRDFLFFKGIPHRVNLYIQRKENSRMETGIIADAWRI